MTGPTTDQQLAALYYLSRAVDYGGRLHDAQVVTRCPPLPSADPPTVRRAQDMLARVQKEREARLRNATFDTARADRTLEAENERRAVEMLTNAQAAIALHGHLLPPSVVRHLRERAAYRRGNERSGVAGD